jgi:hypothetical protein
LSDQELALRVAGIREVFEETNVFLGQPPFEPKQQKELRALVQKDSSAFLSLCNDANRKLQLDLLRSW